MEQNNTGTTMTFTHGERLTTRGNDVDEVYIVLKGKIKAMTTYGTFYLGPGSIVGLIDSYYGMYIYNYFVEEEALVKQYQVSSSSDIDKIIKLQADNTGIFVIMQSRYISELIKTYLELRISCREKDNSYQPDARINKWELDKFNALPSISGKITAEFFKSNLSVALGGLYDGARFAASINDACLQMAEFLEINMDYVEEEPEEDFIFAIEDTPADFLVMDENEFDQEAASAELTKSLAKILAYSEIPEEDAADFLHYMDTYKHFKDPDSLSDEARQVRRDISKLFYQIYLHTFKKAVDSYNIPTVITMFLNFGYMDEELVGMDNALDLYKLALSVETLCHGDGVYTCFTWLREIFWGDKEPSKNMMDMDYAETVKSNRKLGHISSVDEEKALQDNEAKVAFEVENMFTNANRAVYGHSSSFCPVLTTLDIERPFSALIATAEKIKSSLNSIISKDYSAFYREVIYKNTSVNIEREFIMQQVLPSIILMPCTGSTAMMWQEIEGRRKDSPARFILPIFPTLNVTNLLVSVTGRFRWEMCKRVQGVYWNNLTERSLTSEYCDYIQFYKKNRDLSEGAKAKMKATLTSSRNNYREVFVKDYETWILYEAAGSFRLNKVARNILATYCPFVSAIRKHLAETNPMVKDSFEGAERLVLQKRKHLDLITGNIEKKGQIVPVELLEYKMFLEK